MKKARIFNSLALGSVLALAGCGVTGTHAAIGTLTGSAVGAGTGAIIGTAISGGDVAASAIAGGAIGAASGLAAGLIYSHYSEAKAEERFQNQIMENQQTIYDRQRDIDFLREQMRRDSPVGEPDESMREHIHTGPTLGNYYR